MNLLLDILVPQLARPHGWLAPLIAPLLDRGNQAINQHTIAALDVAPAERVLEVGFGGGVGLATLLAHEPAAVLSGIDFSIEMVRRCRQRFGDRVHLEHGSVDALPFEQGAFDKIFGVNVSYFWPDLPRAFAELWRTLVPGGLLVLGVRPAEVLRRMQFEQAGHRVWSPAQYVEALSAAGYLGALARRVPDPSGAYVLTARRT